MIRLFSVFRNLFSANASDVNENVVRYRKINANSLQSIYENLLECNFDSIYSCDEVDVGIRSLIEIIQKEYDRVCPIISKTVSYKQTIKLWINCDLLNKF